MGIIEWSAETRERFNQDGFKTATQASIQELWMGLLRRFGKYLYNYGEHVFDHDWDVLLLLDTCRWDVLAEVSDEYSFLEGYDPTEDSINSIGSRSPEWVDKTFNHGSYADLLSSTAYVTANPHSEDIHSPDRLGYFDEVWRYGWESWIGNVPPENVTDRAIDVWRTEEADRMVVHYMQPHQPYRQLARKYPEWFDWVGASQDASKDDFNTDKFIWHRLRDNEISHEEMWEAYKDNLRWALDSVEVFLQNVDAGDVIITSDHGEAFGEWGCYGHHSHVPIRELKQVPWFRTSGTDSKEYQPKVTPKTTELTDKDVQDRLQALGYQ